MKKKIFIIFLIISLSFLSMFFFSGCKASYPKEKVIESVVSLCKNEIGREVECAQKGKTFYTIVKVENIADKQGRLTDAAYDIIQKVLLSVNRVSLSTDADLDFFVVIISDVSMGVHIVFTQYVDDLRRWILSNISRNDFFSRSLTEFHTNKKGYLFDESQLEDITLPMFIARQTAFRVKKELEKNMILQLLMNVSKVEGFFKDGIFEYRIIKVDPETDIILDKKGDKYPEMDILETIKKMHKEVVSKYKFTQYKSVLIKTDDTVLYESFL